MLFTDNTYWELGLSLTKSFDITRKFIEILFQNIQEKHMLQMVDYVEENEGVPVETR